MKCKNCEERNERHKKNAKIARLTMRTLVSCSAILLGGASIVGAVFLWSLGYSKNMGDVTTPLSAAIVYGSLILILLGYKYGEDAK